MTQENLQLPNPDKFSPVHLKTLLKFKLSLEKLLKSIVESSNELFKGNKNGTKLEAYLLKIITSFLNPDLSGTIEDVCKKYEFQPTRPIYVEIAGRTFTVIRSWKVMAELLQQAGSENLHYASTEGVNHDKFGYGNNVFGKQGKGWSER